MFCKKCGKEIKAEKFCSFCGTEQLQQNMKSQKTEGEVKWNETEIKQEHNSTTKESLRKVLNRKILITIVVLLMCVLILLWLQPSKSEKFIDLLKRGEYELATTYYQEQLAGDEKEIQKVYEEVTSEISNIVDSYYSDSISFDDAVNSVDTYSNFYYTEVGNALQKIKALKSSKDVFAEAEEKYNAQEYREAYQLYSQLKGADNNFAVEEKMEHCYAMIKDRILADAAVLVEEQGYMIAVESLDEKISFFNDEDKVEVNQKIEEYKNLFLETMLARYNERFVIEDYESCFSILQMVVGELGTTDKINEISENLHVAYETYISEQVGGCLAVKDVNAGMQWIRQGQNFIPTSEVFADLELLVQEYIPVSLHEMEPFAIGDFDLWTSASREDTMGSMHENVIRGSMDSSDNQYSVYNLEGKYNVLTGTIAVDKGSIGSKKIGFIKIYGDEVLLWEDTNIDALTEPYDISVNVSGVKHLKIVMCGQGKAWSSGICVMLCNPILQK